VFGSMIQRMILKDLLKVFSVSLVAITGLLLLAGLFTEATQRGLEPGQILTIIPLLIPSTLPYTLPATTLFATCVVYGRLAHDNEILAIKAAGINILRVVVPAVILGVVMSAVTAFLYFETIPTTHFMLRTRVVEDVEDYLYALLKRHNSIQHPKLGYVIYVKRVEGRKLLEANFLRRDAKGNFDVQAWAREAELRVNLAQKQILVHMRDCHVAGQQDTGFFANKIWPVDLPPDIATATKTRENHLTWLELFERRDQLIDDIAQIDADINAHQAVMNQKGAPDNYPKHVKDRRYMKRHKEQQLQSIDCEIQMRPALSLGCLCFVLVGCPVGIWLSRSDYLSAFITCFLPIVFIYYPLLLCSINISRTGYLMGLALWGPDALMGVAALVLFRKLMKN
jgi:lipopolysaccharide export system permease protein